MVKVLWLLECRDTRGYWWRLFPLYAVDEKEAQASAKHILRDHPHLIAEKLVQQSYGFVIMFTRLPGHIQA